MVTTIALEEDAPGLGTARVVTTITWRADHFSDPTDCPRGGFTRRLQTVEEELATTIRGRVWEGAALPPSGERRNKLSGPPCKGETGERSDDERLQTRPWPGLPSRAGKVARKRKGKAPGAATL